MGFSRPGYRSEQPFLLQGILPAQGLSTGHLQDRQILHQLSHREAQEHWSGWPVPSPADLPDPGGFVLRTVLEENTGRTLSHINSSSIFFGPSPGEMEIKTEINK